jgi:hypothetical protein
MDAGVGYEGAMNGRGVPHGKGVGVYVFDCGGIKERYEGDWVDGKREGKGRLTDSEGNEKYVGEWMIDKRDGKGKETLSDGEYVGELKNNERNGEGVLRDKSGKVLFQGRWIDGVFVYEVCARYIYIYIYIYVFFLLLCIFLMSLCCPSLYYFSYVVFPFI